MRVRLYLIGVPPQELSAVRLWDGVELVQSPHPTIGDADGIADAMRDALIAHEASKGEPFIWLSAAVR